MTWRSRLIRFRLSSDGGGEGGEQGSDSFGCCSGVFADQCNEVLGGLDGGGIGGMLPSGLSLEEFLVH